MVTIMPMIAEKLPTPTEIIKRRAMLTLASGARDAVELDRWLDMLGLPEPRHLRSTQKGK